jgi:hypothetical protein
MQTLIATYTVALMAISIYAVWLVIGSRRVSRRLERLEAVASHDPQTPAQKIA